MSLARPPKTFFFCKSLSIFVRAVVHFYSLLLLLLGYALFFHCFTYYSFCSHNVVFTNYNWNCTWLNGICEWVRKARMIWQAPLASSLAYCTLIMSTRKVIFFTDEPLLVDDVKFFASWECLSTNEACEALEMKHFVSSPSHQVRRQNSLAAPGAFCTKPPARRTRR